MATVQLPPLFGNRGRQEPIPENVAVFVRSTVELARGFPRDLGGPLVFLPRFWRISPDLHKYRVLLVGRFIWERRKFAGRGRSAVPLKVHAFLTG